MKRKQIYLLVLMIVAVVGIGGYAAFDRFVGNNVDIESVMAPIEETAGGGETAEAAGATEAGAEATDTAAATVAPEDVNGQWSIADGSKVYWSVTTSKETVNFVNEAVTGAWTVDLNDAAAMTGEGVLDMTALQSGNGTRDDHVKTREDLLDTATYPQATFKAATFSALPAEWIEGTALPLQITGILVVKGKEKEVTFDSEAMYRDGQLLLSGKTKVTFADFGMTSPHTVVLETENELTVQLELVLNKA
ncbi:YceI family protein [Paenibacillus alkalitolerans]|uniref:YceI family protein n=1 Tax=Paenibacillus alkalitolerans TaxID=2799335 RepID=UPI0018F41620|nr:YceI family protein [Paenibacillus alkalitolerans]